MLEGMSSQSTPQRLDMVRELIREKGLSRQDLELLDEILRLGATDLAPLLEPQSERSETEEESPAATRLRRTFGLFLAFLNQFSDRRLGEMRPAMGLVLQHSLTQLGQLAQAAHCDILTRNGEPDWVVNLMDLIAALGTMATALEAEDQAHFITHWHAFLEESRDHFKQLFRVLGERQEGQPLAHRLNQQMKSLNRALAAGSERTNEHIRKLEALLESALPEETRHRAEPLLLVQHVITSLRMSLFRPLDRGMHWPAVEHVRGSLQWLWDHLGWTLPRVELDVLERSLPQEVRELLRALRQDHPDAFRIVARALASHLALLSFVEHLEPTASMPILDRYAAVPLFFVVEVELGRLSERVYHPRVAEALPPQSEEALLLGAFLRQAVLSLLQDQSTVRGLLQQTLATNDTDQLAATLDNLRGLLLSHQRQLMADLVGLFSPELRQRFFPDSPSLTEEGDRLRQRLRRIWEYLDPAHQQILLNLELEDWPRLALSLAQSQNQLSAFRRSPEFLLIRSQDRTEFDRLTQAFFRCLDNPEDIQASLREGSDLVGEILRFLDVFLLRINARVPLIRLDFQSSRESLRLARTLLDTPIGDSERARTTHKLIQTTKPLGVRDLQVLNLLKRWVRAERSGKDTKTSLEALASHMERLSSRLDAALS
jgi:hypothetical protein